MKRVMGLAVAVGIASLLLGACSNDDVRPGPELVVSEESDLLALYLSGELRPPSELSSQIYADLSYIRSTFAVEHAALDTVSFKPYWAPSQVEIEFDEATGEMVMNQEYEAWDELNASFGVSDIKAPGWGGNRTYILTCDQLLHARRLVELYADLPGVDSTRVRDGYCLGANVYPRVTDTGITYLFVHGQGAVCFDYLMTRFWYFEPDGQEYELVGVRDMSSWMPQPDWWEDAELNLAQHRDM